MAIRIVHELLLHVSQDTEQKQSLFERPESLSRLTIDSFSKHTSNSFEVADTATLDLSLGHVTSPAKGVYLEVEADCDVKLNGSSDPIQMRRAPAGGAQTSAANRAKLFIEGNITAIRVEANQGADVTGWYVVWGDVLPPPS